MPRCCNCWSRHARRASRALEAELGFERLYVIGTPCSDNTSTARYHEFLALMAQQVGTTPAAITYLEFRADYHVELRLADGRRHAVPFLCLPLSQLPADFFPLTCRTCVDYTNVLADITVGYMGGTGEQWLPPAACRCGACRSGCGRWWAG